jgi:hypothetical protein
MPQEPHYRRDPSLPSQEIEGQVVVVVPSRRELHELDEVATFLWKELARPRRAEELTRALCEEYEVEPETAERDVQAFLALLKEKGLVAE